MFKKVKKVTISSPQKNDLPKPQTRPQSRFTNYSITAGSIFILLCVCSDYPIEDEGADTSESDQRVRVLSRHSRTGSLDRKKRYNTSSTSLNKLNGTRLPAKSQAKVRGATTRSGNLDSVCIGISYVNLWCMVVCI